MAEKRIESKERISREQIEQRAHEIYIKRGGGDGRDLEDWFAAEEELKREMRFR